MYQMIQLLIRGQICIISVRYVHDKNNLNHALYDLTTITSYICLSNSIKVLFYELWIIWMAMFQPLSNINFAW